MKTLFIAFAAAAAALLWCEKAQAKPCNPSGTVAIQTDEADELDNGLNSMAVQAGVAARYDSFGYSFARNDEHGLSFTERKACLEKWRSAAGRTLLARHFRHMTDADLAGSGVTLAQIKQRIIQGAPFGARRQYERLMGPFDFYIAGAGPACSARGGAVIAGLLSWLPDEFTQSDFGEVHIMFIGLGACATRTGVSGPFIEFTREEINDAVDEAVEDRDGG